MIPTRTSRHGGIGRVISAGIVSFALSTACSGVQSSEINAPGGLWAEVQRLEADTSQVVPKPTIMPPDLSAVFASQLDGQYFVVYAHGGYNVTLCHSGPPIPCAAGELIRKVVFGTDELFMYLTAVDKVPKSMEIGTVRQFWNSVEFSEEIPST